jgi:SAM-dependent methyltransferase
MEDFSHIAPFYEALFPARPAQLEFLEGALPGGVPARWVDIACGTGQQLEALADRGREIWGLDLDEGMLTGFRVRRPDLTDRVLSGDMRKADRLLLDHIGGPAGVLYCIGNSLVQLTEDQQIGDALAAFGRLMAPGAALALQIVNFDRVLAGDFEIFKPLERTLGDGSSFILERRYQPSTRKGCVVFHTRLTTSQGIAEKSHELRALKRGELKALLERAGFHSTAWYGDYDRTDWNTGRPATIVTALT